MKILPVNSAKTTGFKKNPRVLSAPFSNEGSLTNIQAYGLTCLLTAIPGVEFAKKGFKDASAAGKARKIAGGAGIMFGLAVPIFAVLKSLNILRRPAGEKNNPNN